MENVIPAFKIKHVNITYRAYYSEGVWVQIPTGAGWIYTFLTLSIPYYIICR